MAGRPWHYLINTFLVATFGSYRAMSKIANYTLNALNLPDNTLLYIQYNRLLPLVTDFSIKYALWIASLGTSAGSVNSLYVEFQMLRGTYIITWDLQIQTVYRIKTEMYKSLMKNRRKPFQQGSFEDRFIALKALAKLLIGVPGLGATLTDVNAKIAIMQGLMDAQSTDKSGKNTSSDILEASRIALGKMLYGVLGQLMDIFQDTPKDIAAYFDTTTIRNMEQTIWKRFAKAAKTAYMFTRTLLPTDKLRLVNLGLSTLRFSFVATKNGVITQGYIDVPPMSGVTVSRTVLGLMTNRYFTVQNLSDDERGKYMVVLI